MSKPDSPGPKAPFVWTVPYVPESSAEDELASGPQPDGSYIMRNPPMEPWRYPEAVDAWLPLPAEQRERVQALRERLDLDELD
ncbi:MAG: hypothetical protein GY884_01780 [Proteobacteria bacterium]|nr:hypothetical protein [Pseudomonadota bacterium]